MPGFKNRDQAPKAWDKTESTANVSTKTPDGEPAAKAKVGAGKSAGVKAPKGKGKVGNGRISR